MSNIFYNISMDLTPLEIEAYLAADGRCPYLDWYRAIKDKRTRAIIQTRINRLATGNPGDCKPVGEGIHELRVHHGAGYRIYFAYDGRALVILMLGGDKSTQTKDVQTAQVYWNEYKSRKGGNPHG